MANLHIHKLRLLYARHCFVTSQVVRRHRSAWVSLAVALLLMPMALSPTHPIAVYGYLAATYLPEMRPVYADVGDGLTSFLISPGQVQRYREELLADMADAASGKLFAITQEPGGALRHAPIRTWNSFFPNSLPQGVRRWLDRKEFPFLADEVELWQQGHTIVAVGHYHAFGGGPSAGDRLAQSLREVPEVVVSNGIVPMIYVRGALLPYGGNVQVPTTIFRSMRSLERSLTMGIEDTSPVPSEPTLALRSFLAYLRDFEGVDISRRQDIAQKTAELCRAFQTAYLPYFERNLTIGRYPDHPDKASAVRNLTALQGWSGIYRLKPEEMG